MEAMIALAVLSLAGVSMVSFLTASLHDLAGMRERERTLATAERVLTATTLLTRSDFDRRLGRRQVGEFYVYVQRTERTLYRIAITETSAPDVELLITVVYREAA